MKKYRVVFGLSAQQRKQYYYTGWGVPRTVTISAPTDAQAEMLARLKDIKISVVKKTGPNRHETLVPATVMHMYEITNRKIF